MRTKINIHNLIGIIVLSVLLTSCNSSNNVVSSFGKRKYTKGYYFNTVTHKNLKEPILSSHNCSVKTSKINTDENAFYKLARKAISIKITRPENSTIFITKHVKLGELNVALAPKITLDTSNGLHPKTNSNSIQHSVDYGIPGHQNTLDLSNYKADRYATTGFIFGILGFVVFPPLLILGLIFSISGLKSKNHHSLAVAGLVLSIIGLAIIVVVILLLVTMLLP